MNYKYGYMLLFILVYVASFSSRANQLSMQERLVILHRVERSHPEYLNVKRNELIEAAYHKLFSRFQNKTAIKKLKSSEVKYLYMASDLVAFYLPSKRHVQDMQLDISELKLRGEVLNLYYKNLYDRYIEARMFLNARDLSKSHPGLKIDRLPDIRSKVISNDASSVYTVDKHKRQLTRTPFRLGVGPKVIIVTDPMCHFSENASSALLDDPVLGEIFEHDATWIVPPEPSLNFDVIQRWNKNHPNEPMVLAYSAKDWPMFNSWETPTFYFFNNGKLITEVVGWPRSGRREELISAAKKIGLIPKKLSISEKGLH